MQKQKNGGVEAGSFTYDYYANGNVKQIKSGSTVKVAYGYDEFNRLIAEINYAAGKKFAYTYDSAGNVLTKYTYNITNNVIAAVASDVTTYGYTNPLWRDQLTKINNRYTIEYDAAGNPVKYKDYALEWKGNRLTKFDNTTFAYDINGLRVKKNDTHYYLSGDKIIVERRVEDGAVKFVYYRYDDSGVCGMNYDGTDYYFRKNIFGDIIEVFAADGTSVATFVYDAYGKVLTESGTMASKVPFRYRGYYYDQETRLYYLQSRYYDPATGRFISSDSIEYLDPAVIYGLNLYAYCGNNPVNYSDDTGHFPILACILGLTALIGMGLTIGGVASDNNVITAIGLTMVAIPALISGVGALLSGATYLSVIGGVTASAGLFTGMFATAEYQEAFTGNNWIIDTTGMSEEWYNGLMLATATIATAGTIATGVLTSVGNAATPSQMLRNFNKNPNRWKTVKELIEPGRTSHKGGISTYSNYINKWTGSKLGIHKIVRDGRFIHGPHFHSWI